MATSADLISIALSPAFSSRIQYLAMQSAISVATEDSGTTSHAARLRFANDVLSGRVNMNQLSLIVLTNGSIAGEASLSDLGAAVPDSDIVFQLSSVWTALGLARSS